jgi:drug/metabolite transporter (DMT)-like permease
LSWAVIAFGFAALAPLAVAFDVGVDPSSIGRWAAIGLTAVLTGGLGLFATALFRLPPRDLAPVDEDA